MLLLILTIISHYFALDLYKGQTFSYKYNSTVESSADNGSESSHSNITTTLNATFTVMGTATDGVFMKLTVSNMKIKIRDSNSSHNADDVKARNQIKQRCKNPLYFKYLKNGTITDVLAHEKDDEETVNIKVNVAYSLRTNLAIDSESDASEYTVIDPMGKHDEIAIQSVRGNSREINAFYSEDMFDQFSDDQISKEELSVNCQMYHVVDDAKISQVTTTTSVVVNKKASKKEEEDVPIKYSGSFLLDHHTEMADTPVENDEIVSLPKFLSQNRKFHRVAKLRPSYYMKSMVSLSQRYNSNLEYLSDDHIPSSKLNTKETSDGCPASCTLCKRIAADQSLGNSNIGLAFSASAIIGVEKGCKSAKRSYIVGAYVNLDLKVLGKTFSVVDGIAEYGLVNGESKSNQISLSLFGNSVYSKRFTQFECSEGTINLFKGSVNLPCKFVFPVFCVLVTVEIGVKLEFKGDVVYHICPNELNASITFVPLVTATLYGSVSANIIIASATISLSASVSDSLEPTVYADGNKCRIGFKLVNNFHGIKAELGYSYRILFWKNSGRIWGNEWSGHSTPLIDKSFI